MGGGGGGARGALGDLQWSGGSDRGRVGVRVQGGQRSNAGGRSHSQRGHRPAVLACCLTHNDLHHTGAAHNGGGH